MIGLYFRVTNKQKADLEVSQEIKAIYEKDINDVDRVYTDLGGKEPPPPPYIPPTPTLPEVKEQDLITSGGNVTNKSSAGVIEIAWLDLENNVIENPLPPNVVTGMTPIKWDGTTEENTTTSDTNWYNYQAQTGANDGHTSMWANARTNNNDYLVWIPRYAYKITYFGGATDQEAINNANYYRANGRTGDFQESWITGYSTVYGMIVKEGNDYKLVEGTARDITNKVQTTGYTDYIPHPAFTNEGNNGFGELKGIWVGKFESSSSTPTATNGGGNVTTLDVKIVPNVPSWRVIQVSNIFTVCQVFAANNSLSNIDSHMMKNTEWGAVAYLTHSRYGRNGTEVRINNNNGFYTGWGASSDNASNVTYSASSTDNLWTGQYGQLASTTGNTTGIYDMSGGAYEYTAAYIDNGHSNLTTYCSSLKIAAEKYKDRYAYGSPDNQANNYTANASRYGDAVYETSTSGTGATSWFSDYSYFPSSSAPVFRRGGYYDDGTYAGLFNFNFYYRQFGQRLRVSYSSLSTLICGTEFRNLLKHPK